MAILITKQLRYRLGSTTSKLEEAGFEGTEQEEVDPTEEEIWGGELINKTAEE